MPTEWEDRVFGYFGMRKIALGKVEGEPHLRPLLNNKFLFQTGMLDQARRASRLI